MNTSSEDWHNSIYNTESDRASRDGNNYYDSDYRQRRSSYNREGGARNNRPRFTPNREGNRYNAERSFDGERSPRPRFRSEEGGRNARPRFQAHREGGYERVSYGHEDRPQRSRFSNEHRPERPQRNYGERTDYGHRLQRPDFGNEWTPNQERSFRPRFQQEGSSFDRPRRPRFGGESEGGFRPRIGEGRSQGGFRPRQRTADYDPNAKYSKKKQIQYKEQYVDPNEPIRLNKFLANAGVCSRREADEFITAGVVSVNGEVVTELGTKIKRSDVVKFHEQPINIERKIYILLNKPKDTVTTSDDPQERRTVMDLVKGAFPERVYPVGRLDRNTTGVLLLTNDGDLASKLTHPKFLKKKIYHVYLDKNLTRADMDQIASGIKLEDLEIHADAISYVDEDKKDQVGIEIHSGQNRIVRRIFESLGYRVVKLDRVYFAGLTKKGLKRGDWRYLTEAEVNFLRMGSFE